MKMTDFTEKFVTILFTGEDITKVEHVFHCFKEESDQNSDMLLVWVISKENAYHVYCVSVKEQ